MMMINNTIATTSTSGNIVDDNVDNNDPNISNANQTTISLPPPPPQHTSSQHLLSQQNITASNPQSQFSNNTLITSTASRLSRKKAKKQKNTSNLNINNNNNPINNKAKRNSFLSLSSFNSNNTNENQNENLPNNDNQQQNEHQNDNTTSVNEMIIHNNNNNSINDHLVHHQHHNEMIATVSNDPIPSLYPNMESNSLSNETQGITKRNVIIHKDSRGYGMRISGDNPVFIQHVNEEGAAYKAGVRSGDQIIKVNGTLVTRLGHTEVVRMIQSGGLFVGLTLLSSTTTNITTNSSSIDSQLHLPSPANSPTPLSQSTTLSTTNLPLSAVLLTNNNSIRITGPQPVPESTQQQYHENHIRTLQEMINNEWRHLEELKLMRASQPELDRCQKRINEMKSKLEMHKSTISSSMANHSRQQSFENDQQQSNSSMTSPRIIPMDDDVDLDPESSYQYEYIDDTDLDREGISKPIVKSSSNPSASMRSYVTATNNNRDKSKRDSKISLLETSPVSSPQAWFNLHLDSLRLCRYLIKQKMMAPNGLLFYVMAKTVFPKIVTASTVFPNNKAQVIQRWAYQIIATFITKESPLFIQEFPQEYLEQFDRNLTILISANPPASDISSPFEPFLISIQEMVRKQWEEFMIFSQRQRVSTANNSSTWLQTNPKHDLQSTIEMLLTTHSQSTTTAAGNTNNNIQAKLDLRDIDSILDSFVQLVKLNQLETTMALISSLLAIGRYIFNITTSKHCLLLECSSGGNSSTTLATIQVNPIAVSSSLNPLLKLSSETSHPKKSGHKRNSMIPIGSKSFSATALGNSFDSSLLSSLSNGKSSQGAGAIIEDRSHYFVPILEMNHIIYCTSCMLPMWGDPYTLKCTKCLMYTHLWCRKTSAANNICNNDNQHQHSLSSQSGKQSNSNRRAKSEKKSVFEKITGKKVSKRNDFISGSLTRTSSCSSSSSSDSISSLISSSDSEDHIVAVVTKNDDHLIKKDSESTNQTIIATTALLTGTNQSNSIVNRSGSFVQRKKKKSSTSVGSPRKRSDPALTSKQISTMTGNNVTVTGSGTLPQLTSARSSGALMNSASVGAHDSQFRPITGQRAKHMTASDSSLMSVTSASKIKSPMSSASGTINIGSNNDSNKSSSTNLTSTSSPRRTRHRNTNDSAIQMDGSSEDDLNDLEPGNEQSNDMLNEIDTTTVPPPPPPPPPPPSFSVPPPLPPRPDSQTEKRRQIQMEIVQTEEEHHEVLRYVREVYQKPLKDEKLFTREQIDIIFGNIKKLKSIHRKILNKLNVANKLHLQSMNSNVFYLEEAIHDIFCGELGTQLEDEASKFCVNRKIRNGIELWNQRKKDARLRGWVDSESRSRSMPENPLARLGLDDLLSRVFQRPLRYPLLFERLLKSTPKDSPGYYYLEQALISCRKSGERINEATKKAELRARLSELIRKTDFSYFSNSSLVENLEQYELLHEGPLVWRITKQKLVDVLLVLTDQIMLVLTRESNDRYVLKSHINPTTKHGHRPDIKMDDLLMRDVATDPSAFFLVSKNQDIIYEFAAPTSNEQNKWKNVITKAIDEYRANHPSLVQLQLHKSFTSTRSMTMMDLKTTPNDSDSAPPIPPPSILNRPLPKLPCDSSPPPLPPPSSTFINRPLPKLPIDSQPPPPPPPPHQHQPKYDGSIQYVSSRDCHPSTVDLVPFSQIKISSNPRVTHRSKSDDLKEINDNIQNLIQERRRSGTTNYDDLEREIQEMSLVYDIAKHDADSKETLSRLITDMFRKATEWSYHFIQGNESAKQELSQRVRNSVESFVKSHIDSNFILPLPDDIDQVDECSDSLFDNNNNSNTDATSESLINPLMILQMTSSKQKQQDFQVRRSSSDKSNKSDKIQESGFDYSHDQTNLNQKRTKNDDNFHIVEDLNSDIQLLQNDHQKLSCSPNSLDALSRSPVLSPSPSANSILEHHTDVSTTTNPEVNSIVIEEFVVIHENSGNKSISNDSNDSNNQQINISDISSDPNNGQMEPLSFPSSGMSNLIVKSVNQSSLDSPVPTTVPTTVPCTTTTTSQMYLI